MYLEGVQDGRKLLKQVTEINRTKPVIILKAGLTESGRRAVASHTGSLAGGERIWNAFFRQSGAVQVESLEEMAEAAVALLHLGQCRGRRVVVLTAGGGAGVAAADSCSKAGMDLPTLRPEIARRLREFIPPAGNMIRNPIDAANIFFDLDLLGETLKVLSEGSCADMFIISLHLDWLYNVGTQSHFEKIAGYVAREARKYTEGKPLVVVGRQYQDEPDLVKWSAIMREILLQAEVPLYLGLGRAVRALSKLAQYYEFRRKNG